MSGLIVQHSLRAARSFSQGERLRALVGPIVGKPTRTSIHVGKNRHIEDDMGRYVNHSCRPSAYVAGNELRASRPILKGEEITFNYLVHEPAISSPFRCDECGATVGVEPCAATGRSALL